MMSISNVFTKLNAPLRNNRWSWGSVREEDETIFLRVWQDGHKKINDKKYVWISRKQPKSGDIGEKERLEHVLLIKNKSYKCYMIMCVAENIQASTRKIKSFNKKELFIGGEIVDLDDSYWIEIPMQRVPIQKLIDNISKTT